MRPLEKSMVFVTGKGGVGKTTVAVTLARRAASEGGRAIVCELQGQGRAAAMLGIEHRPYAELDAGGGLHLISIDPERATREYLEHRLPVKAMSQILSRSRLFSYLAAATPGLAEMVALGKVWELSGDRHRVSEGEPYDLVVVDAPATGHGIGLLETPSTFAEIARVGPLAEQASIIDRALRDRDRTGVVAVASTEEMAVSEALELERALAERLGIELDLVVANMVQAGRLERDEVDLVRRAAGRTEPPLGTALGAIADLERRAAAGREQLRRLAAGSGAPLVELPLLAAHQLGPEEIDALAGELGEAMAGQP